MKKYLYSIVLATLILFSTTVVNASNEVYYTNRKNIEMTEQEYNNLLGLGFSEMHIGAMDEQTFLEYKDVQGSILAEQDKYIRSYTITKNGITTHREEEITEEEAMAEKELQSQKPQYRGPSGNYYDGLEVTNLYKVKAKIIGISNAYMMLKTDVEWITMPVYTYNDIIAVGFESAYVHQSSSIAFIEYWHESSGTDGDNTICAPKSETSGGSAIFALPTGSITSLEATVYFTVSKNTGIGTITELRSSGDYAHATSFVNGNDLYSHYWITRPGGISLDSTYSMNYLNGTAAQASFVGTW